MELKIEHLTKKYKDKTAADDVNLTITPGIWGLLGANGAGKTTLMRMIAGIMRPTSGCVKFDGVNIESLGGAYRDIFGYLPQEFGFYPEFTVQDYLEYVAALKGLTKKNTRDKIEELLTRLTLEDVRRKKIVKLSGGMKRRVGIAQALLNEPEVLILDEPTSGLDPGERVRFRNLLSEFAQNRIVLISTHIVPDVEYIAFRNAIMKDGGIVSEGTTEELVGIMEGKVWSTEMPQCDVHKAEQKAKVVNLRNISGSVVSVRYLSEEKIFPDSIEEQPRLEDLYLWLFPQEEAGKEGVR
ncbi:ABC transporter ATP-binding protein [Faecalicatena orotica]|uniref:ABC transporter ATP-binding protein n=1 Tax=Faecalicatena orotica TaxID=1544 RepID=UPI0031D6B232